MIFECTDRKFGVVAAVSVQRNNMEVSLVLVEVFLHVVGALVVNDVDIGGWTVLL